MESMQRVADRRISNWLLLGVGMIMVQVMLGGITRLTESGLSITEWKPITGMLPPLSDAAWAAEFDKYKNTDQFRYVHQSFSVSDFKFIFFWEWFHRVWARLMGLVFLAGFIYFLVKKQFRKGMVMPMIVLFILGGIQGAIGWIMVKSGLVPEKYFVGHVELTTHFIAALGLLAYVLWFALTLRVNESQRIGGITNLRKGLVFLLVLLILQLILGGFMAGLRAAVVAPTWPSINGQWIPPAAFEQEPVLLNWVNHPLAVHLAHRTVAYILFLSCFFWVVRAKMIPSGYRLFGYFRWALAAGILLQLLLGIFTVLNATYSNRLIWLGVLHQFTAMLVLIILVVLLFLLPKRGSGTFVAA